MFKCIVIFSICVLGAERMKVNGENQNVTTASTANHSRQNSSRHYVWPEHNQVFAEQVYKPQSGYAYPSIVQNQKLTFDYDNTLHIYLLQNKFSLFCATDTTYEEITWTKYTCPSQIGIQPGETIAVGPVVSNSHLYGVNSFRRNEEYVSELLIKQPLIPSTDGAYVCEGLFTSNKNPYDATTTVQDIVIIGGKGMYQNCVNSVTKIASRRSRNLTRYGF